MRQALFTRLERLEQRSRDGVGFMVKTEEKTWLAVYNGKTREFPTEHAAIAYLERLTETIIIDDL